MILFILHDVASHGYLQTRPFFQMTDVFLIVGHLFQRSTKTF